MPQVKNVFDEIVDLLIQIGDTEPSDSGGPVKLDDRVIGSIAGPEYENLRKFFELKVILEKKFEAKLSEYKPSQRSAARDKFVTEAMHLNALSILIHNGVWETIAMYFPEIRKCKNPEIRAGWIIVETPIGNEDCPIPGAERIGTASCWISKDGLLIIATELQTKIVIDDRKEQPTATEKLPVAESATDASASTEEAHGVELEEKPSTEKVEETTDRR